jgi:NADP-dependent 3-hydroxy acid dehydrogenase YdfG
MNYVEGKIAVITGAGSGIGRALARQLNGDGCKLYLSDINADSLNETRELLSRTDVPAEVTVLDVADKAGMYNWSNSIAAIENHVDIVINNAGVALGSTVEDTQYEDIEWLMGINFWGVVYGTKAFLPLLRQSKQGHLINISSVFGMISVPTQSAYNAAKFAVRGFTEALRQELADTNVHVCCVHPGGIKTNIARASRGGPPHVSAQERGDAFEKMARTTPEQAAEKIITAIEKRKKQLLIGLDAKIISLACRLFPVSYTRIIKALSRPEGSIDS